MIRHIIRITCSAAIAAWLPPALAASADTCIASPALNSCKACHPLTPGTPSSRTGPNLIDIFGSPAGNRDDFKYSRTMMEARAKGLIWTVETLDSYMANPARFLKGITDSTGVYKMLYQLRDEEKRTEAIEGLKALSRCEE